MWERANARPLIIGRPARADLRELVLGQRARGHVALYRYIAELDDVFVLAIRARKEAGYTATWAREGKRRPNRQSFGDGRTLRLARLRAAEITVMEPEPRVSGLGQGDVLVKIRHLYLTTDFV